MSHRLSPPPTPSRKGRFAKVDKKRAADAGLAAFVAGLKGAKAVLDTASIPGASAVFSIILSCIDEAQKASRNADILKAARTHLDVILEILMPLEAVPEAQRDPDVSRALKMAAIDLAIDLRTKAEVVNDKTTHAFRPAWMTRGSDEEALQDFVRGLEDALKQFQMAQSTRIERYLETIKQQTSAIREDVEVIKENTREIRRRGTATEKETNAILQRAEAIEGRTETIDNSTAATLRKVLTLEDEAVAARQRDWDAILRDFRRAPLASYNAERPGTITSCSEQTRVKLLEQIDTWIADPNADPLYWLKERAGFGKTAIALSVAERAAKRGDLAASFFFSHQVPDLNTASLFFPTIAFQLAQFDEGRSQQLFVEAIKKFPDAAAAKLTHQVEALFVKPLQRAEPTSQPIVIVVDALDECNREHAQELVDVLTKALQDVSVPIRVFVTSRPENHLIGAFEEVGISSREITDTSEEDVETYLRKELADIPRKLRLRDMASDWISEEDIVTLVRRAAGLFIYASTAIRFLGDPVALNPRKRLKILLLDDDAQSSAYQPFAPLDRLYTRVLDLATSGQQDLVEEVHVVLGGRIVINQTLTLAIVANLLGLEAPDVRRTLVKLQSVIVCPDIDHGEVTFHHASFKDFLLDSSRSGPIYSIDLPVHHHRLALKTMQIIVQSPYGKEVQTAMASEDYVFDKRCEGMDGMSKELIYALVYSFVSIAESPKDDTLRNAFDAFLRHGALWWLESGIPLLKLGAMLAVYTWRASQENAPIGAITLKAYHSLLPEFLWYSGPMHKCFAFPRKELRRCLHLASEPEVNPDVNTRVLSLYRNLRACAGKVQPQVSASSSKAAVEFAKELEGIMDEFMISMGRQEEVAASRRQTQHMRSALHEDLIIEGVIPRDERSGGEAPTTSARNSPAEGDVDSGPGNCASSARSDSIPMTSDEPETPAPAAE